MKDNNTFMTDDCKEQYRRNVCSWLSVHTFACLLLLLEVDEQEARTLGAEGQQDALEHRWDDGEGQEQRPQLVRAQQSLQAKDLQTGRSHLPSVPHATSRTSGSSRWGVDRD